MKKIFLLLSVIAAFSILLNADIRSNTSSSSIFRLHILHVNDTHSHVDPTKISVKFQGIKTYVYTGGYAKLAKYLNDEKKIDSHVLTLHAGDVVQGTLYYNLFGGEVGVRAFNKMHIDAYVLGNHAFDRGEKNLEENFVSKVDAPVLSANTIVSDKDKALKHAIKPYIIKVIDGKKIAIIGLSVDSSKLSSPGPTISFANYLDVAKKMVERVKKVEGVNKIIALTHLGYDTDKVLASSVPDIDIIVGGHSHTLIGDFSNLGLHSAGNYPTVISHNGTKTLIVTAWKWEKVVGNLNVIFDKDGRVIRYYGTPVMLLSDKFLRKDAHWKKTEVNASEKIKIEDMISSMPNIKIQKPQIDVENLIKRYKPKVQELMKSVIGRATINLTNERLPRATVDESGQILKQGSLIAPIVAKAMYLKAKKIARVDFAMQNAGGIRVAIPQGDVSVGEIMQMLPFGNRLVILSMSGKDIKDMFEQAIQRSYIKKSNTGAFPYLANAKLVIDYKKSPGKRVREFKIKKDGFWIDLRRDEIYRIATNSYIANGGDYYTQMSAKALNKYDTGFVCSDLFINYTKRVKVLSPASSGD